jgi:hypothetical protein
MHAAHQANNEHATLWSGLGGRASVEMQESLDRMFKPFEDCSSKWFLSAPEAASSTPAVARAAQRWLSRGCSVRRAARSASTFRMR